MKTLGTFLLLAVSCAAQIINPSGSGTPTAAAKADIMDASSNCADAGASDTYACDLSPAITVYTTGIHYRFKANTANTGAATVNFNSLGAKSIKKAAGGITTDPADNDIRSGQWVDLVYDGTNMQMQSLLGNAAAGGAPSGAAGGDLGSTYPNPTVTQAHWTRCNSSAVINFAASPYTVAATDASCDCDATGGNVVINLPASSGGRKEIFFIKTDSSTNTCTINRNGSDTIEGSASVVLLAQYDSLLIRDQPIGSWLKVSPKIPGSAGNIIYNTNGSNFGAVPGTTADIVTDLSTASSNMLLMNRTYTVGHASNTGHIIDTTAILNNATTSENTIAHYYGRLTYTGSAGCGHCLGVLARNSDQGTGGTIAQWDGFYTDQNTSGNPATPVTQYTGYHQVAGALSSTNAANVYTDWAGFRNELQPVSNSSKITTEYGFITDVRGANLSNVTTHHALDVGKCTHASVYLAFIVCGQQSEFQTPVYQTYTMGATSAVPSTASQLYGHFDANFLADSSVVYNYKSFLTHGNAGTGTSTVYYGKNDNGGSATAAKQTVFEAQLASSGAPNTSNKQIGFSALAPANASATITDISGFECADQASGTNTNSPQCFKQLGAATINTYAGVSYLNGNKAFVAADFPTSGVGTALEAITGLTFTLATNTAENIPFSCSFRYSQAVANAAVGFGIKASVAPTQINASGEIYTSTTALTAGNLQGLTTTTATAIVTGTPSAITTVWNVNIRGFIENPSGAASTITFLVSTATAADLVTVKRGSYCTLY